MPYGSEVSTTEDDAVICKLDGVTQYSYHVSGGIPVGDNWTRTGENATHKVAETIQPRAVFVKRTASKKDVKVPTEVWSKRLKTFVYVRKPLQVSFHERRASKGSLTGQDLPPNPLSYLGSNTSFHGDDQVSGQRQDGRIVSYSGAIWARFGLWPKGTTYSDYLEPREWMELTNSPSQEMESLLSSIDDSALSKFYERVKNQHVNVAQMIAERQETARTLSNLIVRFGKSLRDLKRGNISRAAKGLFPHDRQTVANDWLCLQYGLKPLASDIEGMAVALTEEPDLVYDVRVKKHKKMPPTTVYDYDHTNNIRCRTKIIIQGHVDVVYKARLRVKSPALNMVSRLGLTNILSLGWELIPYSFVIDWALPIGNYLNSMDAFAGVELVYAHKTEFISEHRTMTRDFGGLDDDGTYWGPSSTLVRQSITKCQRTIIDSVPALPYPEFKDPISALHIANALALVSNLFRR